MPEYSLKPWVDKSPDPGGHVGFFLWGSVPEPFTLYKGIQALPAGCTLWVDQAGNRQEKQYFRIADILRNAEEQNCPIADPKEATLLLGQAFDDTVRHHLVADVPVGVFLSSGLDSSLLHSCGWLHASERIRAAFDSVAARNSPVLGL